MGLQTTGCRETRREEVKNVPGTTGEDKVCLSIRLTSSTCEKIAGRLSDFYSEWLNITSDREVLRTVRGLQIEFTSHAPSNYPYIPNSGKTKIDLSKFEGDINTLLQKGVITRSKREVGDFVSPIFFVPKKDGSHRMILNLKAFNTFVRYRHFKMDGLSAALQLMRPQCFMASVDLRDAYYSVSIDQTHRKYLRFVLNGEVFEYTCLPNGLASAPRLFTKLLKPVLSTLRAKGFNVVGYIDDIFIQGDTFEDCEKAVKVTVDTFTELGFLVHTVKSELTPTKEIRYLGFILNSAEMIVSPSPEKKAKTKDKSRQLLRPGSVTIRALAEVIGILIANFPGTEFGPLHYRSLERDKIRALQWANGNFDNVTTLSKESCDDLFWWIDNIDSACKKIDHGNPQVTITCDASTQGWGAVFGNKTGQGLWSYEQRKHHINYLELAAIFQGLKTLCSNLHDTHLRIFTDSSVAVTYVNKMGGIKSHLCDRITKSIWLWCIQKNIWPSAAHVPGIANEHADYLSRSEHETTEWSLNELYFNKIVNVFGTPEIDLFASRFNTKVQCFVSWKPDEMAQAVDAFSVKWDCYNFYAFPPFSLIGKSLQKIAREKATGIMVVPLWPGQPWFAKLLEMLASQPFYLPNKKDTLTLPNGQIHPLHKKLKLAVCLISGEPCKNKMYLQKQPKLLFQDGVRVHKNSTPVPSTSGCYFVLKGRLIRFNPL